MNRYSYCNYWVIILLFSFSCKKDKKENDVNIEVEFALDEQIIYEQTVVVDSLSATNEDGSVSTLQGFSESEYLKEDSALDAKDLENSEEPAFVICWTRGDGSGLF